MRPASIACMTLVMLGATPGFSAVYPAFAQTAGNPQNTGPIMPSDIDPRSGMRLPLPKREDLDEAGQKAYDRGNAPGGTIAGLQGPAGVQLFRPKTAAIASALQVARSGDTVLLAGKGHEAYQVLGTENVPFDECAIVREVLGA